MANGCHDNSASIGPKYKNKNSVIQNYVLQCAGVFISQNIKIKKFYAYFSKSSKKLTFFGQKMVKEGEIKLKWQAFEISLYTSALTNTISDKLVKDLIQYVKQICCNRGTRFEKVHFEKNAFKVFFMHCRSCKFIKINYMHNFFKKKNFVKIFQDSILHMFKNINKQKKKN